MYTNGDYWIFYVAIFKEKNMKAYLDLLQYILENGEEKSDRTELIPEQYHLLGISLNLT